MILTREGIQRMIDGVGNGAAGGGGGDISALLAGYATESWVDENYLSIEFFSKLFKAYNSANPAVEIKPNDTQSTITNIKAMFGFWTEQYLSALGQNAGGGGGGVGDVTWDALADNTDTRQIALSHLTTALSGYATQSWVNTQGFLTAITSSQIITALGYTPANNADLANYLPLTGGTLTGSLITNQNLVSRQYVRIIAWPDYGTGEVKLWCDKRTNFNRLVIEDVSKITIGDNTVWASNNDGSGSGLDADLLDGQHGSYYATAASLSNYLPLSGGTITGTSGDTPLILRSNDNDCYIQYKDDNGNSLGYIGCNANGAAYYGSAGLKQIALKDDLSNYLPLTGGTLTGDLTINKTGGYLLADNVVANNYVKINAWPGYGTGDGKLWYDGTSNCIYCINGFIVLGHLGIGVVPTDYNLKVSGTIYASGLISALGNIATSTNDGAYVQIGNAKLVWDNTNNALKLTKIVNNAEVAVNFYATGGVSALGYGVSGGGGAGDVTWALLADNTDDRQIAASHLNVLGGYLPLTGGAITGNLSVGNNLTVTGVVTGGNLVAGNYVKITAWPNYGTGEVKLWCDKRTNFNRLVIEDVSKITIGDNTVWASNNDGSGSGLDADLLDGQHGSYYATAASLSDYLPLSGGTITGTLNISTPSGSSADTLLSINVNSGAAYIAFKSNNSVLGYYGVATNHWPIYFYGQAYNIWTSGNDGSDSGLDADLLDGQHGNYYATASSLSNYLPLSGGTITATSGDTPLILRSNDNDCYIQYKDDNGNSLGYIGCNANGAAYYGSAGLKQIALKDDLSNYLPLTGGTITGNLTVNNNLSTYNYLRVIAWPGYGSGSMDMWYNGNNSLLYCNRGFTISGNVGIGTTPSYPLHVSGAIYSTTDITANSVVYANQGIELNTGGYSASIGGYIDFHYGGTSNDYSVRIIEETANILSIDAKQVSGGTATRAGLVVGGGQNASYIQIGNGRIVWDSANQALRVTSADGTATNLYATGGVSALGMNTIATDGTVSANLVPSATETYNIGSTSYLWKYVYANRFYSYYNSSKYGYFYQGTGGVSIGTSYGFLFLSSDTDIIIETGAGIVIGNDVREYTSYTVEIHGNTYFTGSISAYSVTQRSDMRWKDVVSDFMLNTESIANAPLFKYTFKDGDKRMMVGTSAQYWNVVMPQTVFTDADGMMSLDYGVTALAGVISVAREVSEHERRIARLEAENATLRAKIEDLKAA